MDCLPKASIAQEAYRMGFEDGLRRHALIAALRAHKSPRSRGRPKLPLDPSSPEAWAIQLMSEHPVSRARFIKRWCFYVFVCGVEPRYVMPARLRGALPRNEKKAMDAYLKRIVRAQKKAGR
jgi:hypothetical protein